MDPAIERATNALKFVAQHVKNEDNFNSYADDWKYVAMVLDRILLWMFTIACVVGKIRYSNLDEMDCMYVTLLFMQSSPLIRHCWYHYGRSHSLRRQETHRRPVLKDRREI